MTIHILSKAVLFAAGFLLIGTIRAANLQPGQVNEKSDFDISKNTVVVENPDYLRHQSCLGLVYDKITVLVPKECSYRSRLSSADITIYSSVSDFDHKTNAIKTDKDLDKEIYGLKWVALYLTSPLENKISAEFDEPDLKCSEVWSCYYLATKENRTLINRRGVEMKPEVNSEGYSPSHFFVLATDKHKPDELWASYIPGAILFNEQKKVVGFGLDEYSIYSHYSGVNKHKFYRAHFSENISIIYKNRSAGEL